MVSFEDVMDMPLEEVARHRGTHGTAPQGGYYMMADAVMRLREVQAVTKAAEETRRYARYTFWVLVSTAVTAFGTLIVALFTSFDH